MVSFVSNIPDPNNRIVQSATEFKNNLVPSISLNQTPLSTPKTTGSEIPQFKTDLSLLEGLPTSTNFVTPQTQSVKSVATQPQKAEKPWWQNAWQSVTKLIQEPKAIVTKLKQKAVEGFADVTNHPQTPKAETVAATPAATPQKSGNIFEWASNSFKKNFLGQKSTEELAKNTPEAEETENSKTLTSQATQVNNILTRVSAVKSQNLDVSNVSEIQTLLSQIPGMLQTAEASSGIGHLFGQLLSSQNQLETKLTEQQNQKIQNAFQLNT